MLLLPIISDNYGPLLSQPRNQSQDKDALTQMGGGSGAGNLTLNIL